jgi:hypothetical protein
MVRVSQHAGFGDTHHLAGSAEANNNNYGNLHRQDVKGGYGSNAAARNAISEATGWLRAHGMIARKTEDHNADSIFVTRWGTKRSPRV